MVACGKAFSLCLHRWFKECGVSIPSELKMRKRAGEMIGEVPVVVEKVALTFQLKDGKGSVEVRQRPFGYIPDLWAKLVQLLEQNQK
jgi:hypothetical protein